MRNDLHEGDPLKKPLEALDVKEGQAIGLSGSRCVHVGGQVTLVVHLPDGSCFQNVSKGRHTSSASDSCRTRQSSLVHSMPDAKSAEDR